MRKTLLLSVIGILATGLLGGCNEKLKQENAALLQENQTLRMELSDRNGALDEAAMELRDRDNRLAQLQRELDQASAREQTATRTGFEGIPGVTGNVGGGEVTAIVEGDILFASGKTTLRSEAKAALNAVANVLNRTYSGRDIRISGHTDSDPIRKSGHESNYHLAFKRAYAVREYLATRGVDSNRMYLASYGPARPAGSKDQSRRVEISVVLD